MQDLLCFESLICVRIVECEVVGLHVHRHLVVRGVDLPVIPLQPLQVEFISFFLVHLVESLSHLFRIALPQQPLVLASLQLDALELIF